MSRIYTVTIPTSPYVKAFISQLYGDPIRINNKTTIGSFLIGTLSKTSMPAKHSQESRDIRFKFFIDSLTCVASLSDMPVYGFRLTENHIIQINRYLENIFDEQLYFYVQRRINASSRYAGYDKAYEAFITEYNMPENVTMDLLKQIEYRFRKKISKKSLANLTPQKLPPQNLLFA
jgi:hypothetical protein